MQKIICDFCQRNLADKQFKVKELIDTVSFEYGMGMPKSTWAHRDICQECYDKLVKYEYPKDFKAPNIPMY